MFTYTFALSAALLPALRGEAETLLQRMDEKIAAAKTLRIEFVIDEKERGRVARGTLLLAEGNRFREELWVHDSKEPLIIVGDGKRVAEFAPGGGGPKTRPLSEWHNDVLRSWLGRGGTFLALSEADRIARTSDAERPGPGVGPRVTNVRLLPDEEVNGVKCRVVGYDLAWRATGFEFNDARVRLWIDPKTSLPVRRQMGLTIERPGGRFDPRPHSGGWSGPPVSQTWTCTATHTKFEIDSKLDDKLFELPKLAARGQEN